MNNAKKAKTKHKNNSFNLFSQKLSFVKFETFSFLNIMEKSSFQYIFIYFKSECPYNKFTLDLKTEEHTKKPFT